MAELTNTQDLPAFNNLKRWTLFTKAPGVEGRTSRLQWVVRDANPRITVYTGIPNDPGYGMISAAMNPETFFVMLELLERIALGEPNTKNMITCKTSSRTEDGTTGERRLVSTVWLGKDAEGIVWISVVAADETRPKIKFEFQISFYHELLKSNGTALSAAESSVLQTISVVKALRNIYSIHTSEFAPRVERSQNYKSNKPTTTTNKTGISFDDDISF